jgi:hypothetical protein
MQGSCCAASNLSNVVDTSHVTQYTLEQCKLVGGVNRTIRAMQLATAFKAPLAQLTCPHCNFPHLDTDATCHTSSKIHVCSNATCNKKYRNASGAFGNPLAEY